MNPTVLDSSVVLGWLLNDSVTAGEDENLISALVFRQRRIVAPPLLLLEVVNACYWRHHLSIDEIQVLLKRLADLDVEYADEDINVLSLVKLVGSVKLSAYDAWYLQITMISGGILVTHDKALLKADPKRCVTPAQWLKGMDV